MKNQFLVLSIFLSTLLLSSCVTINLNRANASSSSKNQVKGSGELVTKVVEIDSFSEINLAVVFDVELIQGDEEKVVITVDDNLQGYISVETQNNQLRVSKTKGAPNFRKSNGQIQVYLKNINQLTNASVGNLSTSSVLVLDELYVKNSAVGNTKLDLNVQDLEIVNSAVGHLSLTGDCENFKFVNSAVGHVKAKDFEVSYLNLKNTAVGNTAINASKEASVKNSAVGNLSIYGNPEIIEFKNSGVGKFKRV